MVWAIPFIVMSNNWGNCRIMTNQKKDTIWTHWGTHKLHYRSLESAYRGVGLRRKRSKTVEFYGYQFHSHTAHSTPLPHHFPLKPLPPKLFPLTSFSSPAPDSPLPLALPNLCKRPPNTTAINTFAHFNHKGYRVSTEELKRISISRTPSSPTGISTYSQETPE